MNLPGPLAPRIADRYSEEAFEIELRALLRRRGLAALTDEVRRELILALGDGRRRRNAWYARERARRAHAPRAVKQIAAE